MIARLPVNARRQIPCTVVGSRNCESERVTFTAPLRTSAPWSNSACTISSMKNGLPPVRSIMSRLSGRSSTASSSKAASSSCALSGPSGLSPICM